MNFRLLLTILYLSVFGGAIGVFAKMALGAFSPLTIIFFRIFISLLFLGVIFFWQKRFISVIRTVFLNWKKLLLLALSGVGAAMIVGFIGLKYTSAIHYGLIYNLSSVFILIFSVFFLKEKLKRRDAVFIFLAFLGAIIIATNGEFYFDLSKSYMIGDLLVLMSAMGWALYSVLGAKFSREKQALDSATLNFGTFLISFVFLVPVIFLLPSGGISVAELSLKTLGGLIGLSVFSTAILFFLWLRFVDKQGGVWATLISLSENLTGVLLPIMFLNEKMTVPIAIGGVLMIFSISGKELWGRRDKNSTITNP